MRVITTYDESTGELGAVLTLPAHANLPRDSAYIEGRYDRLSQRVDLATLQVVEYQPDAPGADHEWRAENPNAADRFGQRWRWVKRQLQLKRERELAILQRQIEALERRQARPQRELAVDPANDAARDRLRAIDVEIASLRAQLSVP